MESSEITKAIDKVGSSFNVAPLKVIIDKFEAKVKGMTEESNKHRVAGDDSETQSVAYSTQAKKLYNVLEKARKAAKDPYFQFGKKIDETVSPVTKALKAIETNERKKCKNYRNELLRKKREAEAKAAAAEAKKAQAKKPSAFAGLNTAKPVKESTGKVEVLTGGSAKYETVLVPSLEDISKVPARYLQVDWTLVKSDIKNGIKSIPGIKMTEEVDMRVRS